MARQTTILTLRLDDAGMRLTAEEFAHMNFQEPSIDKTMRGDSHAAGTMHHIGQR